MINFNKWDIVYPLRYPESIYCEHCRNYFSIPYNQRCSHCNTNHNVSNIIDKVRPAILWVDKTRWFKNMTFGIPISSQLYTDNFNEFVAMDQINFITTNLQLIKPFRAVIYQATRIDGSAINEFSLIGKIVDKTIQNKINIKLLEWLFNELS